MTDTSTTATELLTLDPAKVEPDPLNPRDALRDLDELTASVKERGVLVPITVRVLDNGKHMVVHGHRRREAALRAKKPLPAILDGAGDDQGRTIDRLVENMQRDDFKPTEEARAVQQLLDFGMTEDEITVATALPADHVKAVAQIARSTTATTVAEKYDLTFDQALGLAEFDTDKEIVKELTVIAKQRPQDFDHTLERYRENRAKQAVYEAAVKEWEEKGYEVLDSRPAYDDKKCVDIDYLRTGEKANAPRVTEKNHAQCPGRAVRIGVNWDGDSWVEEYCTDWKANGHVDSRGGGRGLGSGSKASGDATKSAEDLAREAKEKEERRLNLACIGAGKAAQTVRRKYVADLIARKTPPPAVLPFAIGAALMYRIEDEGQMFAELTGVTPPPDKWSGTQAAQTRFLTGCTQQRLPLALFARIAAHVEARWEPNTWKIMGDEVKKLRQNYLAMLTTVGYTPALIERVQMGKAKPAAVLAEADKEKAAAKATKAGATTTAAKINESTKRVPTKAAAPTKKAPAKRVAKKRAPRSRAAARKR